MGCLALFKEGLRGVHQRFWLREHSLWVFDPDVVVDVEEIMRVNLAHDS